MLVIYKIAVKFIFDFGVDFKFEVDNRVFSAANGSVDLPRVSWCQITDIVEINAFVIGFLDEQFNVQSFIVN